MIINISELFNQYEKSKEINCISEMKSINYNNKEIFFTRPVQLSGIIRSSGKIFDLEANIKATFTVECDRCLENFNYNLDFDFTEKLSLSENSEDIIIISGSSIQMDEILIENILLNLPIQFLCNEDCKGLCSTCGTNKNERECSCSVHSIDPRLSVLKDLFK